MADLITTARARYNLNNLTTTGAEDTTIAAIVTACSAAIKKHCAREFDSQTFDEVYSGTGTDRLLLRQFPIQSVVRVAYDPAAVLRVRNTSASNQRATVAVTSTGLALVRVASGVTTTDTSVTWSGNATLTAVATAVNALANGWSAEVADARFADWPAADLRLQGAKNAKDGAEIVLHTRELTDFDVDTASGTLLLTGGLVGGWFGGPNYWRVVYTAGFATIPEDIQEACAQWAASLFWKSKRDPGLASESVPNTISRAPYRQMPPEVLSLLEPYRQRRIMPL